jgi:hypothetical protein
MRAAAARVVSHVRCHVQAYAGLRHVRSGATGWGGRSDAAAFQGQGLAQGHGGGAGGNGVPPFAAGEDAVSEHVC